MRALVELCGVGEAKFFSYGTHEPSLPFMGAGSVIRLLFFPVAEFGLRGGVEDT